MLDIKHSSHPYILIKQKLRIILHVILVIFYLSLQLALPIFMKSSCGVCWLCFPSHSWLYFSVYGVSTQYCKHLYFFILNNPTIFFCAFLIVSFDGSQLFALYKKNLHGPCAVFKKITHQFPFGIDVVPAPGSTNCK